MRKLIGIPLWNLGDNSVGATKPYMTYLNYFGDVVILGPNTFVPNLDLLVLPGGKDVMNGGQGEFSYANSDGERFLEHFDRNTLGKYIKNNTPILGICRGWQALANYFGMPLVQNIDWDHGYSSDETDLKAHGVNFMPAWVEYFKQEGVPLPLKIESFHHQGVLLSNLSKDFSLIASSDEKDVNNRIVEYCKHNKLPIIGIQGHPERNYSRLCSYLINLLLNKN